MRTPPLMSSFGQLRRRRRAPSDQSASENKEEEAFLEAAIRGGGGATHRSNETNSTPARSPADATPPRVAVALTASPSADGGSPVNTVHDDRAAAAGDAFDVAARRSGEFLMAERQAGLEGGGGVGSGGWGGVFGGARRRITR